MFRGAISVWQLTGDTCDIIGLENKLHESAREGDQEQHTALPFDWLRSLWTSSKTLRISWVAAMTREAPTCSYLDKFEEMDGAISGRSVARTEL